MWPTEQCGFETPGVETFSSGRNHILKFPALTDFARNTFCVMATSAASERVYNIGWACRE